MSVTCTRSMTADDRKAEGRPLNDLEVVNPCRSCDAPVYLLNGDGAAHDYYTHALHCCPAPQGGDCDECRGTGWYTGFLDREPCSRGCSGNNQYVVPVSGA